MAAKVVFELFQESTPVVGDLMTGCDVRKSATLYVCIMIQVLLLA